MQSRYSLPSSFKQKSTRSKSQSAAQTSRAISKEEFVQLLRSRYSASPQSTNKSGTSNLILKILACILLLAILLAGISAMHRIANSTTPTAETESSGNSTGNNISVSPEEDTATDNSAQLTLPNTEIILGLAYIPPTSPTNVEPTNNLQSIITAWATSTSAQVGIEIYDLDHQALLASYNENTSFPVASIYKLFYAYDGYMQIDNNIIQYETKYLTSSDKGELSFGQCLDLIIRESYNGCAERMFADKSYINRVLKLISNLGLKNTTDAVLTSTAHDLTTLLKYIYNHPDLSMDSWAKLQESMLNQPFNMRKGLPNGFHEANVYAKVGFDGGIYNETAIVEFPEQDRHYTIVVLTNGLPSYTYLTNLGEQIETYLLIFS